MDFTDLKALVNEKVIDRFDHNYLNRTFSNPTAEIMAESIFMVLKSCLPENVFLVSVRLWETRTSYAEYRE